MQPGLVAASAAASLAQAKRRQECTTRGGQLLAAHRRRRAGDAGGLAGGGPGHLLDRHGAFHLLPALLLIFLLVGGLALRAGLSAWLASEWVVPWLLAPILFSGLALRLSGVSHGLPDIIAHHCETSRQLDLISQFLSGDLIPPSSYPLLLGHIYTRPCSSSR